MRSTSARLLVVFTLLAACTDRAPPDIDEAPREIFVVNNLAESDVPECALVYTRADSPARDIVFVVTDHKSHDPRGLLRIGGTLFTVNVAKDPNPTPTWDYLLRTFTDAEGTLVVKEIMRSAQAFNMPEGVDFAGTLTFEFGGAVQSISAHGVRCRRPTG